MRKILELELSKDSYYDKSYLLNRINYGLQETLPTFHSAFNHTGIRFLLLSSFHDAEIIDFFNTEKYGKNCVVMRIDFKGTTTEFKKGLRIFDLYFYNSEIINVPEKSKKLFILSLDCKKESQNYLINMELACFTKEQEHQFTCQIICKDIEIKPAN